MKVSSTRVIGLDFAMLYAVGFFLFSIVLTLLWRRWFERGPLESLMRKISGLPFCGFIRLLYRRILLIIHTSISK
ncbi:Protein of unknown function (DUF418) [Brevibacillus sp. BC25]|nr:Protein of unknown function (DUF418) [Brevibacillus sp. BC25]